MDIGRFYFFFLSYTHFFQHFPHFEPHNAIRREQIAQVVLLVPSNGNNMVRIWHSANFPFLHRFHLFFSLKIKPYYFGT